MADLSDRKFFQQLARWEAETRRAISVATGELPDVSEGAVAGRVRRSRDDRWFFFAHYLPHLFPDPITAHHHRLAKLGDAEPTLLVLAFRGFGKSTQVTYAETLRELVVGATEFAVLTSRTDAQTFPLVLQLRLEFEANHRLRQDFGDRTGGAVWQMGHFALNNGREVMGRSLNSGSRGPRSLKNRRPDLWVLDDLQEKADAKNAKNIDATVDFVISTVIPAMQPRRGKVRVVGTRIAEDCALSRLRDEKNWPTFELPAIDAAGEPADPHRYPLDVLAAKKAQMGSDEFELEYQLVAISREGAFRREWIRYYQPEAIAALPLLCAVYWDPAASTGGDYKAIVSWGLHVESGHYYCLAAFIRQSPSPHEQSLEYWRQAQAIIGHPGRELAIGYEANGFQVLLDYPIEQARQALGLPPLPQQRVVNTVNKDIRVRAMAPLHEAGRVFFLNHDPDQTLLVNQFVFWPKKGTDGPDATRGGYQLIGGLAGAGLSEGLGETDSVGFDGSLAEIA